MAIGRSINRSAISAATMAKALSQPNSRSDGRLDSTVIASPQASTAEVRIKGGPTRMVARSTPTAGSRLDILDLQPVEKMNGGAQAQSERDRQRDDAGELQPLPQQPQQAAGKHDRETGPARC